MNAFTPGPWTIYPETDGTEICAVTMEPKLPIRQIIARPVRGDNWIANARLIAAAPELLDALENLVIDANTVAACYSRNPGNFALALQTMRLSIEQARAAIAKATGEQS